MNYESEIKDSCDRIYRRFLELTGCAPLGSSAVEETVSEDRETELKAEIRRRVADLTLRESIDWIYTQMEWARSNCVESVDSFQAGNSWLENKPLTLAPDDWRPE